jgi:AcrR family transcriptional regulator
MGVALSGREEKRLQTRAVVLDAAERLLQADPSAAFGMRDLAAEAGLSFATPFNQFGSKGAILQALSARCITRMIATFEAAPSAGDTVDRVLTAVDIATAVMLDRSAVNRALVGSLSAPSGEPGAVNAHSTVLWSRAVGAGDGLDLIGSPALDALAHQLAITFRGCLSFWAAGEIRDNDLLASTRSAATIAMLGFTSGPRRDELCRTVLNALRAWS